MTAILQAGGPGGKPLPWVELIVNDLAVLRNHLHVKLAELPNPKECVAPCWQLIQSHPTNWKDIADLYFTSDEDQDNVSADSQKNASATAFVCFSCEASFASAKARDQHMRIRHGARLSVYDHVPDCST